MYNAFLVLCLIMFVHVQCFLCAVFNYCYYYYYYYYYYYCVLFNRIGYMYNASCELCFNYVCTCTMLSLALCLIMFVHVQCFLCAVLNYCYHYYYYCYCVLFDHIGYMYNASCELCFNYVCTCTMLSLVLCLIVFV